MRRPWILIALTVITFFPFIINALGWGVYLYINVGSRDLVFAASQGVSHNACAEHFPPDPTISEFSTTLIQVGPIHLFAEQPGEFQPYRFGIMTTADYFGFEFPWLLIPLTFGLLAASRWRRGNSDKQQVTRINS